MWIYATAYLFLIFSVALEDVIPGFNYWDEIVTILVFLYTINKRHFKVKKENVDLWAQLVLLVVIGLVGNLLHSGLQSNNIIIIKDVFAICKFFVVCYSLRDISTSETEKEKLLKCLGRVSRILIVVTSIVAAVGYVADIGVYTGEIRMVKCFKFVFQHPTFFVSAYVLIAGILIAESCVRNKLFLMLNAVLLFMAQRTKGYVVILAIVLVLIIGEQRIYGLLEKLSHTRKFTISKLKASIAFVVLVVCAYWLGKEKIQEYLFYGLYAARPALYVGGLRLMVDYFPFGSGFGTFASTLSVEEYSKVYSMYGIQNVLGLVEGHAAFAGDVFWPCIYGQLGIIGLLLYLHMLWNILQPIIKNRNISSVRLAQLVLWLYALVASTAEAYFTNSSGVQFAFVVVGLLGCQIKVRSIKS